MPDDPTQTSATSDPAPGDDGGAGTQAPAGFVPQSDLDRVEQQRRTFQAENDRLKAELSRSSAGTPTPKPAPSQGFDPDTFRAELLRDVLSVNELQTAATSLRTEFPHADPALFQGEQLGKFGSPEALRLAAEASHQRVANALPDLRAEVEKEVRAEFAARYGGEGGDPPKGGATPNDPTVQELNAMTSEQWDDLEKRNPGVIDRVLRSAS